MTRRLLALSALLLALALVAGCTSDDDAAGATAAPSTDIGAVQSTLLPCPEQPDTPASGDQLMPDLSFDCIGGGSVDFARAPGVPTVVNIWGSWCPPCREELPVVQQLADAATAADDPVHVLGVISEDGVSQATSFAADAGVSFPGAYDQQADLMAQLGVVGPPYTYFLTADGDIAYVQAGPVDDLAELEQLVADHLGVQL